jgi:hypothetical protein
VGRGSTRGTNWLIYAGQRGSFVARVACVAHLLTLSPQPGSDQPPLGARTRATREGFRDLRDELLPAPANAARSDSASGGCGRVGRCRASENRSEQVNLDSSLDEGVDNQCCCPQRLSTVAAAADVAGACHRAHPHLVDLETTVPGHTSRRSNPVASP